MKYSLLLILLVPLAAQAADLKIATWNLNWLTTRAAGDRGLPADVMPRSDDDFGRLAEYARELNADVVAIQEVDGFPAASKVFPRDQYAIHMTRDHVVQRVGIAVRRPLRYDANPDVDATRLSTLIAFDRRYHAAPWRFRSACPCGSPQERMPGSPDGESQKPVLRRTARPTPHSHRLDRRSAARKPALRHPRGFQPLDGWQ